MKEKKDNAPGDESFKKSVLFQPFHPQDLISYSPHCFPYNSNDVSGENLVSNQIIIS